jgi:histidine triad (HIT) family protein
MPSIFTRIINREISAWIVAEDEHHIAFLDINPLMRGHTLVVPKKEVDYYFDLTSEDFDQLNRFARKVALALQDAIDCERVGVAVMGLEVPHCHIHLIPIRTMDDMNFARPKLKLQPDEFKEIAASIAKKFVP